MKTRISSVFLFLIFFCATVCMFAQKAHASTIVDSDIVTDTVWQATESPYIVSNPIKVASSTTLTISPGVVVLFDLGTEINVNGGLIADGTNDNKIYFTSIDDDTLNSDIDVPIPPLVGDYGGIIFSASSTGEFQNVEMRYAQNSIDALNANVLVSNSVFTNNYLGILIRYGNLEVNNSKFSNNNTPIQVSFTTKFIHANNNFLENTKNVIRMYDNISSNYIFLYDNIPYSLMNNISIASGLTLSIDPGVVIENGTNSGLSISLNNAVLTAIGLPEKRIIFDGILLDFYGFYPSAIIKNTDIKNLVGNFDNAIYANNGSVLLDNVEISNVSGGMQLDGNVYADIENTKIHINNILGYGNGIDIFNGAVALLKNVDIEKSVSTSTDSYIGLYTNTDSSVVASDISISGFSDGIFMNDHASLNAVNLNISNSFDSGIVSINFLYESASTAPYQNNVIKLSKSKISKNKYGIFNYGDTDLDISSSSIYDNTDGGVYINNDDIYGGGEIPMSNNTGEVVNISNNWWGDKSGPYNAIQNPLGKGNGIIETVLDYNQPCTSCTVIKSNRQSQEINFKPWFLRDPSLPQKTPVLIVPGVLGTEISKLKSDGGLEKLWLDLAHNLTDIGDEFMDSLMFKDDLTPADSDLILGDVVRDITYNAKFDTISVFDYSTSLINEFKNQGYAENLDLFVFPYDWRYGVSDDTVNQLKQKIIDIKSQTGSDKVDIVAHSTGGLLVKKYVMQKLTENSLDKVVFVGVPNTGAPKAIKTLLEGDSFDNIFLSDNEMQKIARNLPVVYDLAPTAEYFKNKGSFVRTVNNHFLSSDIDNISFVGLDDFLINRHALNSLAWENSKKLHTVDFDNFDMRTAGVDVYAIDGCKTGTIGKITEVHSNIFPDYYSLAETPGDGTVPLESATNLPLNEDNKYYALKADHGSMLSQDGIRQQIVNIISSTSTAVSDKLITQDVSKCGLSGRAISVYSPLSIDIVDQNGNHSGISSDGISIENYIPNADYEIMGDHKYVYLPTDEGQIYTIKVFGTGDGVFTLTDNSIVDSQTIGMQVFSQIPVSTKLKGNLSLGNITTLSLDVDGDGAIDQIMQPNILDMIESQNFDPEIFANSLKKKQGSIIESLPNAILVSRNSGWVSQTVDRKHAGSVELHEPNVNETPKNFYSKIPQTHEIVYNTIKKAETNEPQKIPEIQLMASPVKSDIPIKKSVMLASAVGLLGLGFISRKFIK